VKYIPIIIRRLLLWGNVLLVIALICSAWFRYLDPATFWVAGFAGLAFPFLWIVNLLFIGVWILYRLKYWLIPLIGLLLAIPALLLTWGFHPFSGSGKPSEGSFTIMSFNCSSMGLKGYKNVKDVRSRIYEEIRKAQPDILCLQEFYTNDHPEKTNNLDSIRLQFQYPYHYFVKHRTHWKTWHYGTILFSKFPILDSSRVDLGGGPSAEDLLTAKLLIHGDTVRVISAHLASYRLDQEDYDVVATPDKDKVKGVMGKMRRSFRLRSAQAKLMRQEIANTPQPLIVVGDFNDIPLSYTYRTIRSNLQDAFLQKGSGFGRTFSALSPTLRIDYILPDQRIAVEDFSIWRRRGFEHFPVMARLSLRK
jgi:endonuclease/exonuclease/phosphatase family metal-dependent hydrolase